MLRFRNRIALLDMRSDEFLNTLVQLGGYCTVGQAKRLGIANSDTRVLAQLRVFEENRFLRKVSVYPVVYQVTKSATRLGALDRRARRPHSPKTVLNRLMAVDFYLEASDWPAKFVFEHERKIALFTDRGCPLAALPHRGGRPYLWEEFFLRVGDGTIAIALVDDQQRSPFSQSQTLIERFSPTLSFLPLHSSLVIITGTTARQKRYEQLLRHPDLTQAQTGAPIPIEPYRIEPSTRVFAHADPATIHRHEQIPTTDRPRSSAWPSNLATIR
jgi:hypothetical protein